MAKKSAKKAPASQNEKPRHDDEQYGEVLYSFSYNMDELNLVNAEGLVGSQRMTQIFAGISMPLLMILIASLYNKENPNYPIAVTTFILFIVLSIVSQQWPRIRNWYVSTSTLVQIGDEARHVVVTPEKIVVEGPDDAVASYSLSELKKVAVDDDGALAKFGGKRYVYIPQRSLSSSRYAGLVKFLREHTR